jgi:rSAM/selenodomain-associated transferase 2
MISIVMPVYNEEAIIADNLDRLSRMKGEFEIIVVDGGSTDCTVEIASRSARVVVSEKGRGVQMNKGASAATGDILLFHHADTILPESAIDDIHAALADSEVAGGTFSKRYDSKHLLLRYAKYYNFTNLHIFGVIAGDQGVFVRRDTFDRIGGFPDIPIMEEFSFTDRLRKNGKIVFLKSTAIVSSRRFEKRGVLRVYLTMLRCVLMHKTGVPQEKIAAFYADVR